MGSLQNRGSGPHPERRRPGGNRKFRGLPALKEPVIREGNRTVLVACSKTGRASWAEFSPTTGGGYAWTRNVPAIPDLNAAKRGAPASSSEASAQGGGMPASSVVWDHWSCGVCGSRSTPLPGSEQYFIWRCGICGVLFCTGGIHPSPDQAGLWETQCPGCGSRRTFSDDDEYGTIDELEGRSGSHVDTSRGLGSGESSNRRGLGSGRPDRRSLT